VLREPSAFLRSFREAMLEQGFPLSTQRQSFAYVADDSWLVDYDALLGAYPTLLETMGIDPAQAPPWEDFRLNVTGSALLNRLRRSALLKSLRHPLSRRRDNEERSSS
jgi:hypothetical protein